MMQPEENHLTVLQRKRSTAPSEMDGAVLFEIGCLYCSFCFVSCRIAEKDSAAWRYMKA